jgi:hypothetical protein
MKSYSVIILFIGKNQVLIKIKFTPTIFFKVLIIRYLFFLTYDFFAYASHFF